MTNKIKTSFFQWIIMLIVLFAACNRPVIRIEHVPGNTPPGSTLYLAGDFNRWDPGDRRFSVQLTNDSLYYLKLPNGFGKLNFKFTRGDWTTVETDICGFDITNRLANYLEVDTLNISIESWKDLEAINCPEVTIVVNKLPEVTPEGATIAIAGNFNEWKPDISSRMTRDSLTGKYLLKLPRKGDDRLVEFKITRGNLLNAEADEFGKEIEKRRFLYGDVDTLFIDVENWEDLQDDSQDYLTIILDRIPKETFDDENIFITGTFNGWYPKDNNYVLNKNSQGKFQIRMPKPAHQIEFKFTRGDWSKQEADKYGYMVSNRTFNPSTGDTLILAIENWTDRSKEMLRRFTVAIEKIPVTTPADDPVYLAASINGWNPGNRNFKFAKKADGRYYLTFESKDSQFEFKITRGSWNKEEADAFGIVIPNRSSNITKNDTLKIEVINWLDVGPKLQDKVVIMLTSIPQSTPKNKQVYIAGTFNNWNPGNPDYILSKNLKGQYYITIPWRDKEIEFKFTLGSWDFEEQDSDRRNVSNRYYKFGYSDTLFFKVDHWKNL